MRIPLVIDEWNSLDLNIEDEQEYDFLIGSIQDILLNDALIISKQLNREEGPYTEPKTSNYVFARFGNAFVDYSSHKYGDKTFERGSLWFYIMSEEPEKVAEYLSAKIPFFTETKEMSEEETALNYSRMPDKLKTIYNQEQIQELLRRLYSNEFEIEDSSLLENVFNEAAKEELVKSLEDIIGLEAAIESL